MAEYIDLTETDAAERESFPVFPMFILIDVSLSMQAPPGAGFGPIDAANESLPGLKAAVEEDATVGEVARIGVMSFAGSTQTDLPLSDLQYIEAMPRLGLRRDGTNFAAAFRHARADIERSIRALGKGTAFYRPVVFFLSDGEHNATHDPWEPALAELTSPANKFAPEIVAIGFNEASAADMQRIASHYALLARRGLDVVSQVREIFKLVIRSVQVNSRSALDAGQGGSDARLTIPANDQFVWLSQQTV